MDNCFFFLTEESQDDTEVAAKAETEIEIGKKMTETGKIKRKIEVIEMRKSLILKYLEIMMKKKLVMKVKMKKLLNLLQSNQKIKKKLSIWIFLILLKFL